MSTVTITMTVEQAAAMNRMLDLATRIHLCHFREITHLAGLGAIKHSNGEALSPHDLCKADDLIEMLSIRFGFQPNANFGIGSPHVSRDAHRGYEIKKVVEKAIAEHREPNPTGIRGVDRDGLIVRYTSDPEPVAVVK